MDAWALTDHGNGSGLAHARSAAVKVQKSGKKYRQLYGVEFYFVPSLEDWQRSLDAHHQSIKDAKTAKEAQARGEEPTVVRPPDEEDEQGGHIVENEEETKESKPGKPEWKKYYHLVVIAKNRVGLGNLFTLVKKSFKHGFYRFPRIDYKMLKEHGEGLVVSTACVGGLASSLIYSEFPDLKFGELHPGLLSGPSSESAARRISGRLDNMVDRFVDCVGRDNFFLELQFNDLGAQHLTNRALIDAAVRNGIPLVATADSHFPSPDKWQARELYKKLGWIGAKLDKTMLPKLEDMKTMLYPKNASQMWDEFCKGREQHEFYQGHEELVRDAIERTHDIAWQMCEDTWIDVSAKLPRFGTPESSSFKQLLELLKESLVAHGLDTKPEYVARLREELEVVKAKGFEDYFLTLYKIFQRSSKRCLAGPARGSGSGSLINYLLEITHVDPVKYDLLFSRFINMGRKGFPDVDCDVSDRDILIEEARNLFGDDAVIPVSNFNTLKLKSLIKDIAKFYDVPFEEVNEMTGPLQSEVEPHARGEDVEKSVFVLKHEDCMKYSEKYRSFMEKYPEVAAHVETLFMENRSIGRHAGGVLIADPAEIERTMPIISVRGELQTPWTEGMNFRNLEDNGFLKFDFLGLTLLKDVENCIRRILVRQGNPKPSFADITQFFDQNLNCRYHEPNDQRVFESVFRGGKFVGVFQFTNSGARNFCTASKPSTIDELAAITAIYRPGPLKANVHRKYVEAINSGKDDDIVDKHPIIKDVLGPTHGFLVFQESWMILAQRLSGFTAVEADEMRKTLVKKSLDTNDKKAGERIALREKFVRGAKELNGLDESLGNDLFDKIEFFSLYGFSKNHSVPYVIDSYYAAWLHTHYETDWLATILQSENGNPDGLKKTIAEVKSYGYRLQEADINYSGDVWSYSEELEAFVPPLSSIKGVGDTAMEEIMAKRPYRSLDDLLYDPDGNWRHSKVNKTALRALCVIEALGSIRELKDGTLQNHRQLLAILTDNKNYETLRKGRWGLSPAQVKKAEKEGRRLVPIIEQLIEEYRGLPDWSRLEKILNRVELTSSAPEELVFPQSFIDRVRAKDVQSVFSIPGGEKGVGWFCASEIQQKVTKKGKAFLRIRAIDNENNSGWLRVWGKFEEPPDPYTLWISEVDNDANWGMATTSWKLKQIKSFE